MRNRTGAISAISTRPWPRLFGRRFRTAKTLRRLCYVKAYVLSVLSRCYRIVRGLDAALLGQALHVGQLAGIEGLVDVAVAVDGQRPGHDLAHPAPAGAARQGHVVRRSIDGAPDAVAGTAGEFQDVGAQWRAGTGALPVWHGLDVDADIEVLGRGSELDGGGGGGREDVLVAGGRARRVRRRDLDDDAQVRPDQYRAA